MVDVDLRRLERRALAGCTESGKRYLQQRLRAGTLTPDRVRLASYLGYPAADEVLGSDRPARPDDLEEWIRGLRDWSETAVARGLIAAGSVVERIVTGDAPRFPCPNDGGLVSPDGCPSCQVGPRYSKLAAEQWLRCPCGQHYFDESIWFFPWQQPEIQRGVCEALLPWALEILRGDDQRLRDLEAAWKATGAPEDETEWLRARAMVGDAFLGRVYLAAFLGHEPARLALHEGEQWYPEDLFPTKSWFQRLTEPGACVRAALTVGRLVRPALERRRAISPLRALDAAEDWIRCPCAQHQDAAAQAAELARSWRPADPDDWSESNSGFCLVEVASCVANPDRASIHATNAGSYAAAGLFNATCPPGFSYATASVEDRAAVDEEIKQAVRRNLVPWVLGRADPAREGSES